MDPHRDEDGDALRRLREAGSDLSRPMAIDFAIDVSDGVAARAIALEVAAAGYRVEVVEEDEDGEGPSWTCYCMREMIPDYEAVIAVQAELDRLAAPYGGRCDGWGSFGNAPEDAPGG